MHKSWPPSLCPYVEDEDVIWCCVCVCVQATPQLRHLVNRMLDPDPTLRPTAAQVLAHPWCALAGGDRKRSHPPAASQATGGDLRSGSASSDCSAASTATSSRRSSVKTGSLTTSSRIHSMPEDFTQARQAAVAAYRSVLNPASTRSNSVSRGIHNTIRLSPILTPAPPGLPSSQPGLFGLWHSISPDQPAEPASNGSPGSRVMETGMQVPQDQPGAELLLFCDQADGEDAEPQRMPRPRSWTPTTSCPIVEPPPRRMSQEDHQAQGQRMSWRRRQTQSQLLSIIFQARTLDPVNY